MATSTWTFLETERCGRCRVFVDVLEATWSADGAATCEACVEDEARLAAASLADDRWVSLVRARASRIPFRVRVAAAATAVAILAFFVAAWISQIAG